MSAGTIVSWDAGGGIQTKNSPLMLQPGSNLLLDNVRQERKNEWRTRPGNTRSVLDDLPGNIPPVIMGPLPTGGIAALVRQTTYGTAARIYNPTVVPKWHSPPTAVFTAPGLQSCCQQTPSMWSRKAVAPMESGQPSSMTCAEGGGYRLTAWWNSQAAANTGIQVSLTTKDGTSLSYYSVFNSDAGASRPRATYCSAANALVLSYVNAAGNLLAWTWDTTTGAIAVSNKLLSAAGYNGAGQGCWHDAIYYGGATITIAYRNRTGTGGLDIVEYNPATNVATVYTPGQNVENTLALMPDPDLSGTRLVVCSSNAPDVRVVRLNAVGVIQTNQLAEAVGTGVCTGVAYNGGVDWMIVYNAVSISVIHAVKRRAGVTSAVAAIYDAGTGVCTLASGAWREPGTDAMRYLACLNAPFASTADQQPTFVELALEFENGSATIYGDWLEPQAKLLPLNAGGFTYARAGLPQVQRVSADRFITALGRVTRINAVADTPGFTGYLNFQYAIDAWTVQYMNATTYTGFQRENGVRTQNCGYIPAGSLLQTATGQLLVSHGGAQRPFQPTLTQGGGGGLTALGVYKYFHTVEMPDENGNVWRSPPSVVATITLTGANNSATVSYENTIFENATRRRVDKLWRTAANGSAYRLVHSVSGGIASTSAIVFVDTVADTVLTNGEPYFSELPATTTPAFSHVVHWNDRLWGVHRDFPTQIWYSKQLSTGFSPEFVGAFVVDLDDSFGDITGLAALDDKIVALKGNATYVAGGDGPDSAGNGAQFNFQLISSEQGSILGSPFLSTGNDVYMVCEGGINRLRRSQESDFVGAAIDRYLSMPLLSSPETVTGMVLSASLNEVRIQTTNYRFVHDRIFDVWERDTGGMSAGIVMTMMLNGQQVFFLANGQMWFEAVDSTTPNDAGTAYAGSLRAPWMRPANMEGWIRLRHLRALGECTAAGVTLQPTLTVYFDNSDNVYETFQPRANLSSIAGPIRVDVKTRKELCTAFSPKLTLPAGDATIRFDAWSALVSIEPGMQGISGASNWQPGPSVASEPCNCAECPAIYPNTATPWQPPAIIVNVVRGQTDLDQCDFMTKYKDQLKVFGWTVVGSSNGTAAAMDGVDRILTYLNWPSQPHGGGLPWIVLRDGNGSQILIIDFGNWGGYATFAIEWSPGGLFVGGSTAASPTATDKQTMNMPSALLGQQNGAYNSLVMVANMTCTVDVKTTRSAIYAANILYNWWSFEKAVNPVAEWVRNNFVLIDIGGGARTGANLPNPGHPICSASNWHNGDTGFSVPTIQGLGPVAQVFFKMTNEGSGSPSEFNADDVYKLPLTNEVSGLPFTPGKMGIRMTQAAPPGQRGHYGEFLDLYCLPDGLVDGDITTYPGWAVFNMILTPWSGATPPRTT